MTVAAGRSSTTRPSDTSPPIVGRVDEDGKAWTEADEAELSVLLFEFTRAAWIHRERCSVCSAGGRWCAALSECFDDIVDWRRSRALRSKAVWLRAQQIAREELQFGGVRIEGARGA